MKAHILYTKTTAIILLVTVIVLVVLPAHAQSPLFLGMTTNGGSNNLGTIFSFNPATNAETVLWNLGSGTDGQNPYGDLTLCPANGLYYGMTYAGGDSGLGTIFSFNPATDSEKVVWSFGRDTDGYWPSGTLFYDTVNGLFYGSTYDGGRLNEGTIFSFNPAADTEMVLWSFGNMPDAQHPSAGFTWGQNGLLYATAEDGGATGYGALVSFDPATGTEAVIYNFTLVGYDANDPAGDLVYNAGTNLYYGFSQYGGHSNFGTVFSFNPTTNRDSVLWNFAGGSDGKYPVGDLAFDPVNDNYYGVVRLGGAGTHGTIESLNPLTDSVVRVCTIGGDSDAVYPKGHLLYYPATGLFYGISGYGGVKSKGTIFSFNPQTSTDSVLWSFGTGADGNLPNGNGLVLYAPRTSTAIHNILPALQVNIYPNPSAGNYTITGLASGQTLVVYDCLGAVVNTTHATGYASQLSIMQQANGIYMVRVFDQDGTPVYQSKLVKAN